jgi:transcriptional regulator with XRE-family HTH domain
MSTTSLSTHLLAKQKAEGLSLAALAKAIGVSVVSARAVLAGTGKPNKTTAQKYADYLGLEVDALTKPAKATKSKPAKATKPAKRGRAAKPAATGKKTEVNLSTIALGELVAVYVDDLAVAVHHASDEQRRFIASILSA